MPPPLGANEQPSHDGVVAYNITSLGPEIVDVLIWRAFSIIGMQRWWFELR